MSTDKDEEKSKETKVFLEDTDSKKPQKKIVKSEPKSAFLGPNIWKNAITLNQLAGEEEDDVKNSSSMEGTAGGFTVMNVDDFLAENDFGFGAMSPDTKEDIYDVESRGSQRESTPRSMKVTTYRIRDNRSLSESSDYSMMDTDTSSTSSANQEQLSRLNKRKNILPKGEKKRSVGKERQQDLNFQPKNWH